MKLSKKLILSFIFSSFFLTGCEFYKNLNLGIFQPMGEIAYQQKTLLITIVLLMLIVVIPVILMTFIFAWKYRAGNKNATYRPNWAHSTMLEIIWWGVPIAIIAVLATLTWISSHKLDPYRPIKSDVKPIKIQVVALKWKWLFIYPDYGIATINFMPFPVNVPLNLEITADAPMNSLAVPQLGGQIYAMEGMTTKIHWIADKEGEFRGYSANYSGSGFSGMKFIAKSSTQKEFDDWVKSVKSSKNILTFESYKKLAENSVNNPPEYFSSKDKELFKKVLAQFPMLHDMSNMEGEHSEHHKH